MRPKECLEQDACPFLWSGGNTLGHGSTEVFEGQIALCILGCDPNRSRLLYGFTPHVSDRYKCFHGFHRKPEPGAVSASRSRIIHYGPERVHMHAWVYSSVCVCVCVHTRR